MWHFGFEVPMSHPSGDGERAAGYRSLAGRGILWLIAVILPRMASLARAHQMLALGAPDVC